ncbi:uncharacterized protein LOC127716173 isoform X2 [Mytilus californianus]|uniref:uncharacterized protein LOC127716173 isoform X2 n=1 Tax=Mytilus californianus TaxID=6549 RepID=UPI002247F2D1|nr:uncharacterized protein LOC127716173 isoform X2 [Mytilus californianus]
MMFKMIFFLVSMALVSQGTTGMYCFHCIHVKADLSNAYNVEHFQKFIDEFSKLRTSACVHKKTNGPLTNIVSCKTSSYQQREQKCGTINGDVVLRQAYLGIDIPTKVTISGCLEVDNGTEAECYTDLNMLNENREILVNFLNKKIGILEMQTGNFTNGQICIIKPSYETGENDKIPNTGCDHVKGCLKVPPSTEAVTTDDHDEGHPNIEELIYKGLILLIVVSLVIFSLTCICWKYELSCKNRWQGTDHNNTTHTNVSENYPPQGETHEYDEVDDGFLNRESSINNGHDVRNSGSSSGDIGICGIDSDGYLNPYHALKSIEITFEQGLSSERSSTQTSIINAQENTVYFQKSE